MPNTVERVNYYKLWLLSNWFWISSSHPLLLYSQYLFLEKIEWPFIPGHTYVWKYRERATLKRKAYNKIYLGNSFNICIYLAAAYITDISHWWEIGINFIKHLDPKIVLPYRCQMLRLVNKTPIHNTQIMFSVHVMHPY